MTTNEPTTSETATLWAALQEAKAAGDPAAVRRIENEMRDLTGAVRFADLTDAQLAARLAAIEGNRAPTGLLAYSPGGGSTGDAGVADLPRMNRAISAQQHVGLEAQRTELLDELARRGLDAGPGGDVARPGRRGIWSRLRAWLRPSPERALARQRAREHAEHGVADGAVEHGRHHGGGHPSQFGGGMF